MQRHSASPLTRCGNLSLHPVHNFLPARLPAFRSLHIVSYNRGGGCSTYQIDQLKGEVRPKDCQFLPFPNSSETLSPRRNGTMLPTADRLPCDHCSPALETGHYAETKTYSDSAWKIRKAKNRLGSARHPDPCNQRTKALTSAYGLVKTASREGSGL